jgi:hypothetical protein
MATEAQKWAEYFQALGRGDKKPTDGQPQVVVNGKTASDQTGKKQ